MRPHRPAAATLLLPLLHAAPAGAQPAADAGLARVALEGSLARDPTRGAFSAAYAPFVTPRWQVGVAPSYTWVDPPGQGVLQAYTVGVLANYVAPVGRRARLYGGGFLSGNGATGGRGYTLYGGQAGALWFVAPAAAVRAEYRLRRADAAGAVWQRVAVVALDPYVGAGAGGRWRAPGAGAADVDFFGSAFFTGRNVYSARGALAPFLAPWAQVGVRADLTYTAAYGNRVPASGTTFGRLYLPLPGRTAPYAEAFGTGAAGGGGIAGADRLLDRYGAEGGVRRYVGPNAAFEFGVNWSRQRPFAVPGGSYRLPDQTTLRLGVVTHLRSRQAP